jgi:hypothetical protein
MIASNDLQQGFGGIGQPIAFVLKPPVSVQRPAMSQPNTELKR